MNKKSFPNRRTRNQKLTWSITEKRVFMIIGLAFILIALVIFRNNAKDDFKKQNAYKAFIGKEVPDSMVCMVSGVVKYKAIHPVEVKGEVYWGCCDRCLHKLSYNVDNVLFTKDPISKKLISKSKAVIRLDPNNQKLAMYFESVETYNQYTQSIKVNNISY
ncbi:MAG: hypothetical protein V2I54_13645 [Bacteroidales bacterium]|jgi:hypothetical protein|nr:hypothetical protein [Bacteroidales bacterium]